MKSPIQSPEPGFPATCTGEVLMALSELRRSTGIVSSDSSLRVNRQLSQAKHAENMPGRKEQRVKCLTGRVKLGINKPSLGHTAAPPPCKLVTASQTPLAIRDSAVPVDNFVDNLSTGQTTRVVGLCIA
jgi:hypothetical protein